MDFEYKQNRRTHSFTLTPRTTHAHERRQTSIYADESTHSHTCAFQYALITIRIQCDAYHMQTHTHTHAHLIQSHAHIHTRTHRTSYPSAAAAAAVAAAAPKKRQQNIKIKFFRLFPASFVNFRRCCALVRTHATKKKHAVLLCSALPPPSFAPKLMATRCAGKYATHFVKLQNPK